MISALRVTVALGLGVLTLVAAAGAAGQTARAGRADNAQDYLVFSETLTAACMRFQARSREIANSHPKRSVRVVLMAHTGTTRAQSPSEFVLAPQSEPRPLGCDAVSGMQRRWAVIEAAFVPGGAGAPQADSGAQQRIAK